jgi:putative ABC transport system permease protein
MIAAVHLTLAQVLAALGLVAVAVAITVWQRLDLEREIAVAVARSFVQLTAIGYVITLIFDHDSLGLVVALIAAMVVFGAFTARARARAVPGAFWALLLALALAGSATLGLVVVLGVFPARPRYLVPVGGMVIGNAMTAAAVALNRLGDDVADNRRQIEATLALGATGRQAIAPLVRRGLRSGVIPLIDSTKTTGLIFFPGTMVGMLLAGADPADAVRLQLVLLYVLLGGVAIAALVAVLLSRRAFFTSAHQLREPMDTAARGVRSWRRGP